jgi:hypothetical protein
MTHPEGIQSLQSVSGDAVRLLRHLVNQSCTTAEEIEVRQLVAALTKSLQEEYDRIMPEHSQALDEYGLLQVNHDLSKYLEEAPPESLILPALWPPFTREVLDAFRSATYDIKEAGNCLAVRSLGKGRIY